MTRSNLNKQDCFLCRPSNKFQGLKLDYLDKFPENKLIAPRDNCPSKNVQGEKEMGNTNNIHHPSEFIAKKLKLSKKNGKIPL